MPETITAPEQKEVTVTPDPQIDFLFNNEGGTTTGIQVMAEPKPATQEPVKSMTPTTAEQEEIINSDDFFRTNFGWESVDAGKREIEELRKLKAAPPAPVFANETSERIFNYIKDGKENELYEYLDKKRKLSDVEKMPGADAIKLHIQQSNPHYTSADIQDVFEEKYVLPEKPLSDGDDADPAYVIQLNKWQTEVDKINRRIERDAYSAKQELAKLNTQLVLPDIQQKTDPNAAVDAQKELENMTAARNSYLAALESDGTKFNGFSAEYKNEEVSIPVNYTITPEEQNALKSRITEFDVDDYLLGRWFPEGKANIPRLQEDLYLLENSGKIFQKMVKDTANKMYDHLRKTQNNINLTGAGNTTQSFQPSGDSTVVKEIEYLWAQG